LIKRVSISDNLFKDIPSIKDSGKIYDLKKGSFIYNLPKKSENNKNVSDSTKYKTLSLFDYIKPILMPDIDVDLYSELHFPSPLFDYQIQGIKFLLSNKSALLADQMGTGKTVMTTTAIRMLFIKGLIKKAMVVVPSNLINVWESHLKNWAPELQFLTINDTKDMRNILWQIKAHVYIISYDTLKNDYKEKLVSLKDFSKNLDLIV
jgi:Superfamily II DNA/RNA helicases, SNF2 family